MKKIHIELQPNVHEKSFMLFDTPEALYVWLKDTEIENSDAYDFLFPTNASVVKIKENEFMEAEWMGCEFVNEKENKKDVCLNFIRAAKATTTKNASGLRVDISYGWIASKSLPFKTHATEDINVKLLTKTDEHKLNLAEIFKDDIESEKQKSNTKPE